jgi:mannose-6-phosphate isomerase-like protein (cupin superfamily)
MIGRDGRKALTRSLLLIALCVAGSRVWAQTPVHGSVSTPAVGGNSFDGPAAILYPKTRDTMERRIDMFMGDWHDSMPRSLYGSLVLRDILTKGDNIHPPRKGAVLQSANFVAYGRLAPNDITVPSTLKGNQEVFYILGGTGEISAGEKTFALHKDIVILMPEELQFTMKCTGNDDLTMYVMDDSLPANFHTIKNMVMTDERTVPVRAPAEQSPYTGPGASGHWAHVVRDLFNRRDGMGNAGDLITVEINPLTLGEPHPHNPGQEEIWLAIDGTSLALMGSQVRVQKPGMAYMVRPDWHMVHSNINYSDKPVKFLWFSSSSKIPVSR